MSPGSIMRWRSFALAAAAAIAATGPAAASAQVEVGAYAPVQPAPVHDDVQWEERVEPYRGGPIRPGAQLQGQVSVWTWVGAGGFVGGYLLALYGAGEGREYAAIPFAGPWLAATGALGGQAWDGAGPALMVISGILQPAGVVVGIIGLLNPDLFLVYDAPLGSPSPFSTASVRLVPEAPGAELGASLVVETF